LYTWGEGRNGQLGHSDFKDALEPKKLDLTVKVEKVLCGANFTMILDDKGKLFAFGDNRYGQLGITGLDNIVLPHPAGIQTFLKKVKDFSCGEDHAAYVDYNGNVFTWGYGIEG
jgi:alpha-tubulin suppressor-like RCC1 family protein